MSENECIHNLPWGTCSLGLQMPAPVVYLKGLSKIQWKVLKKQYCGFLSKGKLISPSGHLTCNAYRLKKKNIVLHVN
jgi:hypothetical protein